MFLVISCSYSFILSYWFTLLTSLFFFLFAVLFNSSHRWTSCGTSSAIATAHAYWRAPSIDGTVPPSGLRHQSPFWRQSRVMWTQHYLQRLVWFRDFFRGDITSHDNHYHKMTQLYSACFIVLLLFVVSILSCATFLPFFSNFFLAAELHSSWILIDNSSYNWHNADSLKIKLTNVANFCRRSCDFASVCRWWAIHFVLFLKLLFPKPGVANLFWQTCQNIKNTVQQANAVPLH